MQARRFSKLFEIPPVSRHERKLARCGYRCDQDVAKILTLTARHTRPDVSRYSRRFLIEGQDDTVRDEGLERLQLPLERLPVTDRQAVASQAFEDRYRGHGQATEARQIVERVFSDGWVASTQLG